MIERFKQYNKNHKLVHDQETILLAVSGGADSMVMADLFLQNQFNFGIAHVNYKLRNEAEQDQEVVAQWCEKNNITFYHKSFDTSALAKKNKTSIQLTARNLRFTWFRELCIEHNFDKIAVASNLNDSIETCLINLTKGTGIKGLHGILPQQQNIIHPLLFATKTEIYAYAKKNDVPYREDQSNAETKYLRNKIRHQIIPTLKEINPSLENTFSEFFNRISSLEALLDEEISRFKVQFVKQTKSEVSIDLSQFINKASTQVMLHEILAPFGFSGAVTHQLLQSLSNQNGKYFFSDTHKATTNQSSVIIRKIEAKEKVTQVEIDEDLSHLQHPIHVTFTYAPAHQIIKNPSVACLDKDLISYPLTLRKWKPGDKFIPLGMKGQKKLSDFFTDHKLSNFEKEDIFVLTSNNQIIWIVGKRIDDRFKVTAKTKNQLTIELIENE